MNDDFLYQLRTEPPPHFATQLKERLDGSSKRKVRLLRYGLGALLFGTAFAIVSPTARIGVVEVIDWIRGVPAPTAEMPGEVDRGLAGAFSDREVGSTDAIEPVRTPDADEHNPAAEGPARASADAPREPTQALRDLLTNPAAATDADADAGDASKGESNESSSGADPSASAQSSFIVTGPLLAEDGTPSYLFDARRAYFTVMSVCSDQIMDMLMRRAPFNATIAQTNARRLELLASMMPELFSKDERSTQIVQTRADPRIWSQPGDFGAQINRFTAATRALSVSIGSHDTEQIAKQMVKVRLACASCHLRFRKGGDDAVGAVYP